MNGREHYLESERLIADCMNRDGSVAMDDSGVVRDSLAAAQAHATLAAAADAVEIRVRGEEVARRARTLDDGTDAGGNVVPPWLLEHADRLGATAPPVRNAGALPVGAWLVLIRHRLTGLADEISSTVSREGRAVQVLAGVVEDLVDVVEQLERRAAVSS